MPPVLGGKSLVTRNEVTRAVASARWTPQAAPGAGLVDARRRRHHRRPVGRALPATGRPPVAGRLGRDPRAPARGGRRATTAFVLGRAGGGGARAGSVVETAVVGP